MELSTDRLLLRRWRVDDREAVYEMNSDPVVMATIGPVLTREQSDAAVDRWEAAFDRYGFGLWCVEVDGSCAGFVGLDVPWFREGVEIGWRLRSSYWGQGIATEAATSVLAYGFGPAGLDEIVSFTAATNARSRRVMERLGLRRDPSADFLHPSLSVDDPLAPHVLYRLAADEYRSRT